MLAFALAGRLEPVVAFSIAALAGLVRPSDIGMRSALVSSTVPPAHLVAAMGVSRATQDSARIAGALTGAGLIASFGMANAYMAIATIYLAGALLTLFVDRGQRPGAAAAAAIGTPAVKRASPWRDLGEGLAYVWNTPQLLAAMSLAALVNLTAFPLTGSLMAYIARDVFQLDQKGFGLLVASFSVGAFIGSVLLSLIGARIKPARTMLAMAIVWYLALHAFVLTDSVWIAMAVLVVAGICQSLSMIMLAIILLRTSDERLRGRIMGVRMLAIYTLPLGLLIAGLLIPSIGYQATALLLVGSGLLLTLEIAVSWRRDLIRRDAVGNAR
jgi:predicted MFS family arabinose efflux permease